MYSHGWQHSLNHGVSDTPSNSPSICGKPDVFFQQEALDNGHAEEHEPVLGMAFSAGSILVFFH